MQKLVVSNAVKKKNPIRTDQKWDVKKLSQHSLATPHLQIVWHTNLPGLKQ